MLSRLVFNFKHFHELGSFYIFVETLYLFQEIRDCDINGPLKWPLICQKYFFYKEFIAVSRIPATLSFNTINVQCNQNKFH